MLIERKFLLRFPLRSDTLIREKKVLHPDWLEGPCPDGPYWQATQVAHWCFLQKGSYV